MIVATAGHVDHGKTSLVKNLTGVDTDRLAEEKRRGLSISLGYAYWRPDSETTVGFIDVPGHRRFINNMISGISGIDVGMLVVAADDGPMPQTFEHLQVLKLLGIDHYLLVISKCDRVDEQRLEQVRSEAVALLPGNTPVYTVSNTTEAGISDLRAELGRMAHNWTARTASENFRMSVDRAFLLQGQGLILTGTIASGVVENGDSIVLQPQKKALRVRSIHTQDRPATRGRAGERCALNVSGNVHKEEVERGDWVADEDCIDASSRFDARIRLLPDAAFPLKHLSEVKLHIGAKHLQARLMLLEGEAGAAAKILPGESALGQLLTERPVLCCHGDRFLLRDFGETATLGGGIVLDPQGPKYRKSSPERLDFLAAMENDDIADAIRAAVIHTTTAAGQSTLDYSALLRAWNIDPQERPGSDIADIARIKTADAEFWMPESSWIALKTSVLDAVVGLHEKDPSEPGFRPSQLAHAALSKGDQHFFQPAIVDLVKSGDVSIKDGLLAASGHKASMSDEQRDWIVISACLEKHARQIPVVTQLEQECGIEKRALMFCIGRAQRDGKVVRISPKRYALASVLTEFAQAALDLTTDNPELTVINYRDHMGCGRNVAVDVLEYFDGIRFTRRVGEGRIILHRTLPVSLPSA